MRLPPQLAPLACFLVLAQPLAASRQAFLRQPLVRVPAIPDVDDPTPLFDWPALHRTRPYSGVSGPLPKAPAFHACRNNEELRDGHLGARYLYQLRFPGDFYPAIPSSIQAKVRERGLDPGRVDVLCVVQTLPWQAGAPIQLRPQGWIDPEAPAQVAHRAEQPVWAGIFEAPARPHGPIHFSGRGDQDFFPTGILVRPGRNHLITGSGFDLVVDGLDYHNSTAFWTLTQLGDRAAATLHILVNDEHQRLLADLSRNRPEISLGEWLEWLNVYAGTEGLAGVDHLNALFGPLPLGERRPAAAGADGEDKADPGTLWRGPAGDTLLIIPEDGILYRAQSVPCVPGKRVQAACAVSMPGLTRGRVRIGLRFDGIGLDMPAESRNDPGMDQQSATADRKVLECRAIVPPKANRVSLFILAEGMVPGQQVVLEPPAFTLEGARPRANPIASGIQSGPAVPRRYQADSEPAGGEAPVRGAASASAWAPYPASASASVSASSSSSASSGSWGLPIPSVSSGSALAPGTAAAFRSGPAQAPLGAPALEILGPPDRVVLLGTPLVLETVRTGLWPEARVAYQWYHRGQPVDDPTATTATLALLSAGAYHAGTYQLKARTGSHTVPCAPVQVTVQVPEEARVGAAAAAARNRAAAGNRAAADDRAAAGNRAPTGNLAAEGKAARSSSAAADSGGAPSSPAAAQGRSAPAAPLPTWVPDMVRVHGGSLPWALTLLPHLTHVPAERNQGRCHNCYLWAAHAAIEMELFRRYGIKDRLSVQYYHAIYAPLRHGDPAHAGLRANPELVARTYLREGVRRLVPWNNAHAHFQDGGPGRGRGPAPLADPHYPLRDLAFEDYVWAGHASQAETVAWVCGQLAQGRVVLLNNSRHYSAIVGYDARSDQPFWIILDSTGANPGTSNVPWEAVDFTATHGPAPINTVAVLTRLELGGRPGPGAVVGLEVTPVGAVDHEGQPLTLVAKVDAHPPASYQWFRNGRPLAGQTGAALHLPTLTRGDQGSYWVTVALPDHPDGAVTSPEVPVQVLPAPAPEGSRQGQGGQ